MAFGGRQLETKVVSQCQERAEIIGGHALRRESECIVNVDERGVLSTITVSDAATRVTSVVRALVGRNSCPIHPCNSPHESLRRERGPSVEVGAETFIGGGEQDCISKLLAKVIGWLDGLKYL